MLQQKGEIKDTQVSGIFQEYFKIFRIFFFDFRIFFSDVCHISLTRRE